MNFFEQQKQAKDTTTESLEQIKKSIEELKKIEESVKELKEIKLSIDRNVNYVTELQLDLRNKFNNLNGTVLENKIKNSIDDIEQKTKLSKLNIERATDNLKDTLRGLESKVNFQYLFFYLPALVFTLVVLLISVMYLKNVTYIKNQAEELVRQNDELRTRVNALYYLELEDQKFWYDKKNQKLFIRDHKWIKDEIKKAKSKQN